MPKPASLSPDLLEARGPYYLRTVAQRTVGEGDERRTEAEEVWHEVTDLRDAEGPNRLLSGPRHVGLRRHVQIDPDVPMDEQGLA